MKNRIPARKIPIIMVLLFLLSMGISNMVLAVPKIEDILAEIDYITELESDGTAKVEITQEVVGEGVKVYELIYYRRDRDDSFLMVILKPEAEKGNGYLRQGDNYWMYRRNTRTFQHINRDHNIAGTNSRGEDFENRKLMETYKPVVDESGQEIISETMLGSIPVYQFEIQAKVDDVLYPKQIFWVRKDNFLPLKIESYSLNGTLMLTSLFLRYTKIEGKYMWVRALFIDEFDIGNKTFIEISNITVKPIEDYIFTRAYLESLSR